MGIGVWGVRGVAGGAGVHGEHSNPLTGIAVLGANTGAKTGGAIGTPSAGVFAEAPLDVDHVALAVSGRVAFLKCSGVLTIAKNTSSVSVPYAALTAGGAGLSPSMVLATLQTNRAGIYIQAAVASPASGKITIYLNKKVTAATKVAYFILG